MPTKMKTDKMAETLTPLVTRVANDEELRAHAKTALDSAKTIYAKIQADGPRKAATSQGRERRVHEGRRRAQGRGRPGCPRSRSKKSHKFAQAPDRRRDRGRRGDRASRRCCRRTRTSSTTSREMGDVSREAAEAAIDVLLQERREFPPPPEFVCPGGRLGSRRLRAGRGRPRRVLARRRRASLLDWHQRADRRGSSGTRRTARGSPTAS